MCSFSTCFKHILILHNSQLATTNWVKGRRMQLTDDKTCCATTLRQMLRCAQTTNVVCVARLSDMLNDPYCPPCVCSTRMACPESLCAPSDAVSSALSKGWLSYSSAWSESLHRGFRISAQLVGIHSRFLWCGAHRMMKPHNNINRNKGYVKNVVVQTHW